MLYWVGYAAAYDRRAMKVARAVRPVAAVTQADFAVLGTEKRCTGESACRMDDEFLFQELTTSNIETFSSHDVKSPYSSLRQDYPQFDGQYEVTHHRQFLAELVAAGRLKATATMNEKVTCHDPASERIGAGHVTEAQIVAVSCPFCLTMMTDGITAKDSEVKVCDVAELMMDENG